MKKNHLLTLTAASILVATGSTRAATITSFSYIYNTTIDNQASAETGNLLNDGEIGEGSWNAGDYVGFGDAGTNAWASITVNLNATYNLATIDLYTYTSFNAGFVEISTSTDNVTFSSPTQYILSNTAVGGSKSSVTDSIDVSALADAQYLTIDWFKTPANPGAGNWVFISEVDFDGSAIPEPSAALLGGLGLLALLRRQRA